MQVKTNKTKVSIKDFYCLSTEDYETLMEEGQVTVKGITITKKDTDVYMIPDELASSTNDGYMSKEDKSKLDAIDPTSVPVNDVKVNDVSVVTAGVANVTVPTDYVNLSTNQEIDGVKTFIERPRAVDHYASTSKNLFKKDFSIFDNQGGTGGIYTYFKLPDDTKTYTLSVRLKDSTVSAVNGSVFGYTTNGGNGSGPMRWLLNKDTINVESVVLTPTSPRFISMYPGNQATFDAFISRYNIQLEEGDTMTDYEDPSGSIHPVYENVALVTDIPALGDAAYKNYTSSVTSSSSDLVTSGAVYTAIDNLPEPMVFKGTLGTNGTITDLPTASSSNEGYTYKVITAGTYASISAKVGDVFVSNGSEWILIPAGDIDSDTWRGINVNGTALLGSAISTGAVNFKNGTNVTISGSGNNITISSTDTNYYPSRSYTAGLQISTSQGIANTCALYVPYASNTQSGVITTGVQSFSGQKTFYDKVFVDDIGIDGLATFNGNLLLGGSQIISGDTNYGLVIPDTSSYTANKTLATTDDIPDDSNLVHKTGNETIDGVKTFFERPLSRQIYKKIEYIQASGTTSAFPYIRTLVKRGAEYGETESLSCILDGYFTETQTQGYCGYDGGGQLGQRNGYWSTEGGNSTVSALTRSTILQVINFNSGYDTLYKDGEQIATRRVSTAVSYSTQSDYPLFVAYNGRYSYQPCTSLRLYSFKMYAGDYFNSPDTCVLIRDFIPILDIDGSPCLLDLVSNKVFTNQGLGSFVGGDEIGTISVDSQLLTNSDVSPVALTNDYNSLDNKPALGDAASKSYTSSVTSGNMNLVTSGGVYTAINNLSNSLATVATSGDYDDLINKPITTSTFVNDGDGITQNDPYAKISDITTPTFIATTFNPGTAITFSQEDLADMYENQYDIIRVTTEILPNVFFNLSFRKTADTEASGLTSVKYDYTTCTNNNQLEEICFQVLKSNDTYSTTSYHLQLANSPVTDVQTSDGTSIVNNTIATLPSIYAHHIYIVGGNQNKTNVYCTLITNFSTSFDLPSFIAYINNMDSTGTVSATGTVIYNRVGTVEYCRAVAALIPGDPANNTIGIVYHDTGDAGVVKTYTAKQGTGNLDLTSLSDMVVKIM